jgi:RNA-dependent RNA polymerase
MFMSRILARIPIRGAYNLVGVADVHQYLRKGQIFVCINKYDGTPAKYLKGRVLVARSPVIHPGDVQLAWAIGAPPAGSCYAKEPLANTVVFNTQGELIRQA